MVKAKTGNDCPQGKNRAADRQSEAALQSEAAFWREMIESNANSQPPEVIERMRRALELVERRIADRGRDLPDVQAELKEKNGGASKVN